jgi:Fe-S-cluster containining protein
MSNRAPAADADAYAHEIDPSVSCANCEAVCCRLTVVLAPEDAMPEHLTAHTAEGVAVMARAADGWCVALDRTRMCCSIYEQRPGVCRKFAMGSPYCRAERENHAYTLVRGLPLKPR